MSKKSETIEIRVSYEMKQRLAQKAQAQGDTMSGLLRQLASDHCNGAFAAPSGGQNLKGWTMTKTIQFSALTLVCGAALATAGLFASQNAAQADDLGAEEFAAMDFNDDGILTQAEYALANQVEMMRYAEPADSARDEPDWPLACDGDFDQQTYAKYAAEEFAALDSDGDGMVTSAQYRAALLNEIRGHFDELDQDQDGRLSKAELQAMLDIPEGDYPADLSDACVKALSDLDAQETAESANDPEVAAQMALADADMAASFAASDIDGDGFLSRAEFLKF